MTTVFVKPAKTSPEENNTCSQPRVGLLLGISAIALIAVPTLTGLMHIWRSNELFNGLLLIPILGIILLYKRLPQIYGIPAQRTTWAYWAAATLVGLMFYASLNSDFRIASVLFVGAIIMWHLACLGIPITKVYLGPLLFFLFMVPIPSVTANGITIFLQNFFSHILHLIFTVSSSEYLRHDGIYFFFDKTQIMVGPECSGLRSLLGISIFACYFGILDRLGKYRFVLLLIISLAIALSFNLIRIITTTSLDLHGLKEYTTGTWHMLLGCAMLLIGANLIRKCSKSLHIRNTEER